MHNLEHSWTQFNGHCVHLHPTVFNNAPCLQCRKHLIHYICLLIELALRYTHKLGCSEFCQFVPKRLFPDSMKTIEKNSRIANSGLSCLLAAAGLQFSECCFWSYPQCSATKWCIVQMIDTCLVLLWSLFFLRIALTEVQINTEGFMIQLAGATATAVQITISDG